MAVDFDKIPECVWELFDEIMWTDRENRGRNVKCSHRTHALGIAWGWEPPLMERGQQKWLTQHGLAAYAWRKQMAKQAEKPTAEKPTAEKPTAEKPNSEDDILELVLAKLTANQGRIMDVLIRKKTKTLSFTALRQIPGAWRDAPTDDAIIKQLKAMRTRLDGMPDLAREVGYLDVSEAKKRVTLTK